jgi:hypothetical protein
MDAAMRERVEAKLRQDGFIPEDATPHLVDVYLRSLHAEQTAVALALRDLNAGLRAQPFVIRLAAAMFAAPFMLWAVWSGYKLPAWYQDTGLQVGEPILRAWRRLTRHGRTG